MGETPCRNCFLESVFASKPWLCWSIESSNFAFCPAAPVCNESPVWERRGAAQCEFMALDFYRRVFVFLGTCGPQNGPWWLRLALHGGSCLVDPPAAGGWVAEARSVCTPFSASRRRNMTSKHQTLGGGTHLYHSVFQTGGHMCPCLNGIPVPTPLIMSRYFGLLFSSAEFYGSIKKTRKRVLVFCGGVNTEVFFVQSIQFWTVKDRVL